ncbi:dihydroceramide fatty acyl 2-hydroxylase FAH2 [Hyposmocoma kahamanoa]|uniref:dihydroceramide fatty acyl 2-hydroxylase FAH2 n=1 Tax=Hyposmocoma kahamanoa TaxID=1477025 RepID=UPI000E6D9826|nr:dihydroceramide fatty acyl 2-hydroxylase FAH2 [Hyposmocoma kahamanoa]
MAFPVNFNGRKYDLKQFLRDHPGGVNTLKMFKGQSVGQVMEKYGHSTSAYHMLNDFKVENELKDYNLSGKVSDNGRIITNEESRRDVKEIAFLEELENRLDWSKPLLSQLDAIAPHYQKWVNSAVYRKCRLFKNPILESLTYTPWYLVPMFWIPIILYLGFVQFLEHVCCGDSCTSKSLTITQYLFHVALGVVIWTALEYSLHRWVFHLDPGASVTMIKIHFLIHGMHHKSCSSKDRNWSTPSSCAIFVQPRAALCRCYLTYDMIHYYVHHGSPKDGTYLYAMKRYHSNHHFVNYDKAYGISSKIWDHVFKTVVQVRTLGFSLHW